MEHLSMNFHLEKYKKCLDLIKSLPNTEDMVENFIQENCKLLCESMVALFENNPDEVLEVHELLYVFWDKVTSVDMTFHCIPLQLKLTATLNFLFWLLFHNDSELKEAEVDCYIELLGKILFRVLGQKDVPKNIRDGLYILDSIYGFKALLHNQDNKTVLLILELVTILVLYIYKLKKTLIDKCLKLIRSFTLEINERNKLKESINAFLGEESSCLCLFKFGLGKTTTTVSSMDESVIGYLCLVESALSYAVGDYNGSLKSLRKNSKFCSKSLFNYLGALNCYKMDNWDLCLGFLYKGLELPLSSKLKARYHIMQGKVECVRRNHKEAIKCFEEASSLHPKLPIIHYLLGQEYGRIGLSDFMAENFEKLLQVMEEYTYEEYKCPNFESIILRIIHPFDEISETEALYVLATAYGLNERFHKAAETFDEIIKSLDVDKLDKSKESNTTSRLPNYLTILHEASITNLLIGNLVRAEQLVFDAMERYTPQEQPEKPNSTQTNWNKDVIWLKKIIQQELLETDPEPKELKEEVRYTEEVFFIFQQNVIALLIQSEIQRIQEVDEYKSTLSNILSIFSSYLALMCKKQVVSDEENYVWTLVKALAGKTCLRIVAALSNSITNPNVDKMYKRALSCNKGDKDALYGYYKYLNDCGKSREALKLWKTFCKEESTIGIDEVQSSALRYFLINKVSRREIDRIQAEIEFTHTHFR